MCEGRRGCVLWYVRPVPDPTQLPEPFAPTGPKQSRFRIVPPGPMRPKLFPDEARYTFRISLLAGGAELAAWSWFAQAGGKGAVLGWAFLRLLKPAWAFLGTRVARPAIAFALLALALAGAAASLLSGGELLMAGLLAVALPAVGDLCASSVGDTITIERRSAAYAWLDMAQGLGAVLGFVLGASFPTVGAFAGAAAVLVASAGVPHLHDRGKPRSTWTLAAYDTVLRTPFGAQLVALSFFGGFLSLQPAHYPTWLTIVLPLVGMALAARADPHMPNAVYLPRIALGIAAAGVFIAPLRLLALGAFFAAIPASVARGAGEMERPVASSLAWSALTLGAAVGAVL
jgi:hypothetical protein